MGHQGRKKINLVLVVLIAIVSLVAFNFGQKFTVNQKSASAASWYNSQWKYRTKIIIDHTKVPSDQIAFPVLVSSTVNDWRTIANGGHVAQSAGQDFVFMASDQSTKLPDEVESYDNSSGKLIAWVKTNISHSVDTEIYLYYGNADCSDQQDVANVWDSNFKNIWHLSEASGLGYDRKNGANMTFTAATQGVAGKIGNAVNFDGTNGFSTFTEENISTAQTVSMWVAEGAGNSGFIFDDQNTTGTLFSGDQVGGGWAMWFQQTPGNYVHVSGPAMTPGQWYLETYVRDGATMSFYRNGEKIADDQILPGGASGDTFINGVGDWSRYKGSLDEAQISTVARSADWIKTEYNNQNDVSVFYSLAATEAGDTIPPTNPTTINGYDTAAKGSLLANGSWNYFTNPYFEFSGATDDSSGIAGYYIYFGTDVSADPQTAGSYQVHAGGTPATQYYTSGSTLATGSTYYLKIKTKDTNSNISAAATLFTYKFDNIAPNPPEYVNVSPVGCSTQTSFTFNWPVAADAGGSDFKTYQYRRGTTGTITDVVDTTLQAFAYQDGDNVLYVRTEDNAGNVSSWQTSVFCSTAAIQVVSGPDVAAGPSSITATWVSSKATTGYVKVYDGNTYISEQGLTNYSLSHTVKVIGLVPEKQYRYQITWTDQSGNLGESDWYTTTTATAPQINNLTAQIISPTSANISWNSTVPAQFNLEYGIGNYGTTIPSTDFLNGYSGKIDGLSSGETYQFRVDATGQDGTKFFAGQSVAMPPLPSIGSLKFQPIANRPDTAITVSWTTNTETTSSVFYGPVGQAKVEVSTSDKIKDHKIDIGNLSDNSDYEIYATGIDQFGNVAKSLMETFKTAYDTRPPVMANISTESSNIGTSSDSTAQITVGLTTDEPAKCMLEYGGGISGTTYSGRTTDDEIFETNHIAVISGLKPQSPYHFRINCSDKSGNKATSSDQTVISGEITQSVFNIIIKTLNNLFGWMGTKL